jgi:peptidoglycan/LPS O-acetylase OafA/YrhL
VTTPAVASAFLVPAARRGSRGRIPSLDGLRAVSIALVLFAHLIGTAGFSLSVDVGSYFALGDLGVRAFFVISGFLISNLLLEEIDTSGRISLFRFYLRRTLRIFPPYYALILVLIVSDSWHWITLGPGDTLHALTYTANYHPSRSWNVGHTWSLSVEEQFYLLWPAVLVLLGPRRGLWAALSFIAVAPIVRFGLWVFVPSARNGLGTSFETVADAIATGCVLACAHEWLHRQRFYRWILTSRWLFLIPILALITGAMASRPRLYYLFGFTLRNMLIVVCVDWCVGNPNGRIGRALNSRPFVFIGAISYSIYLWQQIFLNRFVEAWPTRVPISVILVGSAALASYYLIERPSLRMRQRIENTLFARPLQR